MAGCGQEVPAKEETGRGLAEVEKRNSNELVNKK
jgi:hypothetical protein